MRPCIPCTQPQGQASAHGASGQKPALRGHTEREPRVPTRFPYSGFCSRSARAIVARLIGVPALSTANRGRT